MTAALDWPLMGRDRELRVLLRVLERPDHHGAVLVGPSGVGKTRLAHEALTAVAARGARVERATGSRAAQTIQFGALAHLLPSRAPDTPALADYVRQALAALAADARRVVVSVDDAHLLDEGSATLVHALARSGAALLLLTVRSEEPVPDAVTALWKDGLLDRIELGPLPPVVIERLARRALDGALDDAAVDEVQRLAQGNPLLLREVLLHAVETGVLRHDGDRWRWEGQVRADGRLTELVEHRLHHLDPELRALVDTIAFGEPLNLAVAERLGSLAELEALERRALVTIDEGASVQEAGQPHVRLTHPIVGEVIRAAAPRTLARRTWQRLAEATEAASATEDDAVRYALWRLDSGGEIGPAHLLAAAQRAVSSFDHPLTERLATAAIEAGAGFDAAALLAEALSARGADARAMAAFERARAAATDERDRTRLALGEAQHYLVVRGDAAGALALLRDASDAATTTDAQDELDARIAMYAAMGGDVRAAIEAGERMQQRMDAAPHARVSVYITSTIAQVMAGRGDDAVEPLRHAFELAPQIASEAPLAPFLLRMTEVTRLTCAGKLFEAERLCRAAHRDAAATGAPAIIGLAAEVLGDVLMHRGLVREASELLADARALCAEDDPLGLLNMARGLGAVAATWLGDRTEAATLLDAVDPEVAARDARVRFHADRAAAWSAALDGDLAVATARAVEGAHRAIEADHVTWGASLLHDAVRLDAPGLVAAELTALGPAVDGTLVADFATHAEALAAGDGAALEAAAATFEESGAALLAAETWAHAAVVHRRAGRAGRASGVTLCSGALLEACGGASTPALAGLRDPLTIRERQVALLAGGGATSAAIAERLGITVRTVDNHLGAVYRKLDIHGRRELRTVLDRPARTTLTAPTSMADG